MSKHDWRKKEKCENCPFHDTGPGRHLRDSLMPGRFKSICRGLLKGEVFFCHKHTNESADEDSYIPTNKDRVCAGAIDYARQHGVVAQYVQVCERLEQRRNAPGKDRP